MEERGLQAWLARHGVPDNAARAAAELLGTSPIMTCACLVVLVFTVVDFGLRTHHPDLDLLAGQ